jgi:leucyl-tRNA synthetase
MHKTFDHKKIEEKWQKKWREQSLYDVGERDGNKEKEYVLTELPYPSGNLHVGHWHAFGVPDIYVRFMRMKGKQVVFPMGFDAFGLPAENAAIKNNADPKAWTEANIEYMRNQLESMGNSFSWDKTLSTTDPDYYRWTQWMFSKFFEAGIAYRGKGAVNWCPNCQTVIANEQVTSQDTCERCDTTIEKKVMPQWMFKITDFADSLIDDLDSLDWPDHIKQAQINWIGRSKGAKLPFTLSSGDQLDVFTTRPDTLYGATYLVLAPDYELVQKNQANINNWTEVNTYIEATKLKKDQDRLDNSKEKTGVRLEGLTATNPATGESLPVFIADYVLASYGTGAIMAVPAHDERDYQFATKFNLPIKPVIARHYDLETKDDTKTIDRGEVVDLIIEHPSDGTFLLQREVDKSGPDHVHFVGGGTDGESHEVAIARELLEETGFTNYDIIAGPIEIHTALAYRHTKDKNQRTKSHSYHLKLKDLDQQASEVEDGVHTIEWTEKSQVADNITWVAHQNAWKAGMLGEVYTGDGVLVQSEEFNGFSSAKAKEAITKKVGGEMTNTYRLRDWSFGRQRYWGVPIPIVYSPEGEAHAVPDEYLPWTLPEDVDFRPTGEPPLAKSKELKARTEKIFGPGWTPEVETMDTFVDSSWYFLRYIDNHNSESFSSEKALKDWMPIDIYFGGAEHTTMHLLYSRFWIKALHQLGYLNFSEPYRRRVNRGLIMGPDGHKMSKSKGNVVDPDEQVSLVGADAVKMSLAFMGPYNEVVNYPWDLGGIAGQRRFLERVCGLSNHLKDSTDKEVLVGLHKMVSKVQTDVKQFKFNTAISALMIFLNQAEKAGLDQDAYESFLKTLAPFAPFLTEELWSQLGYETSIHTEKYPDFEPELLVAEEVTIGVQLNGKMRGQITLAPDAKEDEALSAIKQNSQLQNKLEGLSVKKVIYVPGRILNLIVE